MTNTAPSHAQTPRHDGIPLGALASLAVASLITMMTETLPAGLLPQLAAGLHTTASTAGQAISVYAFGSMAAALPLLALTRRRPQRPVLVTATGLVGAATLLTATAANVPTLLAGRALAGIAAGLLWALAAHYAMAITPDGQKARALSIAMLGVPVGMALGTPAGTYLGQAIGWRTMLAMLGAAGLGTAAWAHAALPPLPGADKPPAPADGTHTRGFLSPTLLALYLAAFVFEVAHMTSYTYASQLAARAGNLNPGLLLFAVGIGAVAGLLASGRLLDRSPVLLLAIDLAAMAGALALLWAAGITPPGALLAALAWGLALGPTTTLAQAAAAALAGASADLAQGVLVTVLNAGMASGAALGGILLLTSSPTALPAASAGLLVVAATASLLGLRRSRA